MIRRLLDLILITLILVGGYRSWQSSQERARLRNSHDRLARLTGVMPIADPSRVHILALESDDPTLFAWRFYTPPNYTFIVRDKNGGGSSSSNAPASEFLARLHFREDDQGRIEIHEHMHMSSGRSNLGDTALARLLHGHWSELQVEQFGAPEITTLAADESAVLLRLTLPDHLVEEARKTLNPYEQREYIPTVFELELGPQAPKKP